MFYASYPEIHATINGMPQVGYGLVFGALAVMIIALLLLEAGRRGQLIYYRDNATRAWWTSVLVVWVLLSVGDTVGWYADLIYNSKLFTARLEEKQASRMCQLNANTFGSDNPESFCPLERFNQMIEEELVSGSKVYILPTQKTIDYYSRYYLLGKMKRVDVLAEADYLVLINPVNRYDYRNNHLWQLKDDQWFDLGELAMLSDKEGVALFAKLKK